MTRAKEIEPVAGPVDATVRVPGSKSMTNRALVAAALAAGESTLTGVLHADDTEAMVACLGALGVDLRPEWASAEIRVTGCGGVPPAAEARLDARLSGTTSRFVLPVAALGSGRYRVDGAPPLRARPLGPGLDALRALGVQVVEHGEPGRLPVSLAGGPLPGGEVDLPGDVSSQFLSGLLLAAPSTANGLVAHVTTDLVSRPYALLTATVMRAFGASVERPDQATWAVPPTGYRAIRYGVEPDASAASYAFAAAAICGGQVAVDGLGSRSVQGDVRFVDVLEHMGCRVERSPERIVVRSTGRLRGVDVDMADLSDTAQTLAAVAAFADSPTLVRGIGFIRDKETDRISAVVTELRRCGIEAEETGDGFVVRPGTPQPALVQTYDDHRMAMSFALLGLRTPGIAIADPACVGKTFPGFWDLLESIRATGVQPDG